MNVILQNLKTHYATLSGVVIFLYEWDIAFLYFKKIILCVNVVYKSMNIFRKNLRKPNADYGNEYEESADLIKK